MSSNAEKTLHLLTLHLLTVTVPRYTGVIANRGPLRGGPEGGRAALGVHEFAARPGLPAHGRHRAPASRALSGAACRRDPELPARAEGSAASPAPTRPARRLPSGQGGQRRGAGPGAFGTRLAPPVRRAARQSRALQPPPLSCS